MRKAANRAKDLVHGDDSASSSDEDFGNMGGADKEGRTGTQAGLGFGEESVEIARLRAQVGLSAFRE